MSDESPAKRTRSPLNALKLINALRAEKGLPKIGAKPATVKLSKEAKEELFKKIWVETYPSALLSSTMN